MGCSEDTLIKYVNWKSERRDDIIISQTLLFKFTLEFYIVCVIFLW